MDNFNYYVKDYTWIMNVWLYCMGMLWYYNIVSTVVITIIMNKDEQLLQKLSIIIW